MILQFFLRKIQRYDPVLECARTIGKTVYPGQRQDHNVEIVSLSAAFVACSQSGGALIADLVHTSMGTVADEGHVFL